MSLSLSQYFLLQVLFLPKNLHPQDFLHSIQDSKRAKLKAAQAPVAWAQNLHNITSTTFSLSK